MTDELFAFVGVDQADEDVFVYYDITLKQDFNGQLKVGMYFPFANFNTEKGVLELLDDDGKILHKITLRYEIVSIEHSN